MRIADICSERVICISPDATVQQAAALMHDQDVGALIIVPDGKREPIGIVTDRDVVLRVVATGKDPRATRIAEAMSLSLATCRNNHELLDVLDLMRTRGIRRVPVVDAQTAIIGIVTTDDVIGALSEHVLTLARSVLSEEAIERRRHRGESAATATKEVAA